jgi:hypothetical protein
MHGTFVKEVAAAHLPAGSAAAAPVTENDLSGLPDAAQRYLRFMGVVGRPRDRDFRAHFKGRFRRSPGGGWMPCESWQYNSGIEVARIFVMRARLAGVLPMTARDTYVRGRGQLTGSLLGLVTVVNGSGPEFDVGELVMWLNDAVVMAPSLLLDERTSWSDVDHDSFDLTLTDAGHRILARVFIDKRGAVKDFTTMDKRAALPGGLVEARWHTPITGWRDVHGRQLPTRGSTIYDLEEGPYDYAKFNFAPDSLEYNVAPGA